MLITNFLKIFQPKRYHIFPFLFLITISSVAQDTTAIKKKQDTVVTKKKWKVSSEVYMMFPNMNGVTGIGNLPDAEVDQNVSDVFSHFKIGAMLYLEVANDKWALTSDLAFMHLKEDVKPGTIINSGEVNVKQLTWEFAALRRLSSWLETGIGGRLNNLDNTLDLTTNNIGGGTTSSSRSISQTWVDPIILARIKGTAGKKFIYQFRGDLGGFGIGSDFAWQIQAYGGWQFSKKFQFTAGYRVISIDYEKGSGQDRFLYDMNTFGPVIKFGMLF